MRTVTAALLIMMVSLALATAGCNEKKTAGEPPIALGLAPGEKAAYEPTEPAPTEQAPPAETVTPDEPVPVPPPAELSPGPATQQTDAVRGMYTIRKGDTLIGLARRFYNDQSKWKTIWNANRDKIPNPDRIMPGLEIVLP